MFTQPLPKYIPLDFKILPPEGVPIPWDEKVANDEIYEPFLNEKIPAVWYTEEQAQRVSTITTDVREYVRQKQAQWISGQADVDAEWDEYVSYVEGLGIQELTDMRQELLDEAAANAE